MENCNEDLNKLKSLKIDILSAVVRAGEGHIPSALSVLDIIYCVFGLSSLPNSYSSSKVDFILSKGHASLALYSILSEKGIVSREWVTNYAKFDSNFGGHPDRNKLHGVIASTGSLGHGLPIAIGIALGKKANNSKMNTIVLVGDGELNEGSNWESILVAHHHNLENLTIIVDTNNSTERSLTLGNLQSKMESFGALVKEIDGHNHYEINEALQLKSDGRFKVILAKTIKGNGVEEMMNNPAWHHTIPSQEQLDRFIVEIKS